MRQHRKPLISVVLIAGLLAALLTETHAQPRGRDSEKTKVDDNSDAFCKFEGNADHKPFQCFEKRRYPLGTPCLCPGADRIGRITHQ